MSRVVGSRWRRGGALHGGVEMPGELRVIIESFELWPFSMILSHLHGY